MASETEGLTPYEAFNKEFSRSVIVKARDKAAKLWKLRSYELAADVFLKARHPRKDNKPRRFTHREAMLVATITRAQFLYHFARDLSGYKALPAELVDTIRNSEK